MRTKRIYIAGATGFLGSRFVEYLKRKDYKPLTGRVDITNPVLLRENLKRWKPDVVVNFAGVKAYPNIDWCEKNKEETVRINVAGAINIMLAAIEAGAYPIQISSGCIYDGGPRHPFKEEDEPNFFGSFYSRMRIVLQDALAELPVLYARIRMPVSAIPHPRNTITKIASYKEVISVPNSVTLIEDLCPALEKIMEVRPFGILNLTNKGYVKNEDLLKFYKKIVDPKHSYRKIPVKELKTLAKRSNCILSTEKAGLLGIKMPELTDSRIEEIMRIYKSHLNGRQEGATPK